MRILTLKQVRCKRWLKRRGRRSHRQGRSPRARDVTCRATVTVLGSHGGSGSLRVDLQGRLNRPASSSKVKHLRPAQAQRVRL